MSHTDDFESLEATRNITSTGNALRTYISILIKETKQTQAKTARMLRAAEAQNAETPFNDILIKQLENELAVKEELEKALELKFMSTQRRTKLMRDMRVEKDVQIAILVEAARACQSFIRSFGEARPRIDIAASAVKYLQPALEDERQ